MTNKRRIGFILAFAILAALFAAAGLGRILLAPPPIPLVGVAIDQLPPYQNAALLERAWALPVAAKYRELQSQSNPSFCGPASLANIERSLGKSSTTPKDVLAGSGLCWSGMCWGGLTLDQVAAVARGLGRDARAVRKLSLDAFRDEMKHSNDPTRRYLINFHRGPLFGRGGGHHSPIGGYLEAEDLVFVLDVNRSFQPWLVPTERLWGAMATVDSSTNQERGLVVYTVGDHAQP